MTSSLPSPVASPRTVHALLPQVLAQCESEQKAAVARLIALLRIPSVSTDPAFDGEVRRAAEWLAADLKSMGFSAEVCKTIGHPIVVAHHPGIGSAAKTAPRVLFYGHYDVQPADPLELWTSPPFEPVLVEGKEGTRVVARGAVDDKGQVMSFLEALRAWHAIAGGPPVPVTLMLEGEEESGSRSLEPFMHEAKDQLAGDICIVSDTGMWDANTPAITTRLRGLVYIECTIHGPMRDLHSGMYGGAVPNPIQVLADIISSFHDQDRRITVAGFYEGVDELSAQTKAQWESLGFSDAEFLGDIGLPSGFGERDRSSLERTWSRPTLEVNGIFGGYIGKGAKTVIGAHATAKISCRLVGRQDPERITAALKAHINARLPAGCRAEFELHGANPALSVRESSPCLTAANNALEMVYGCKPLLIGTGGSIPAVGSIKQILGMDSLLIGFGLDDDCVHSPNEKFELRCFYGGTKSHAALLGELSQLSRT
ncbi:MAG: dipeptidase [Phycisphaerales bacterium]|nr:dipeptidase [Phycisphaerales bacterium]